jgi:hypothetical protein
MKKIMIVSGMIMCLSAVSFANNRVETTAETGFFPTHWASANTKNIVKIEDSTNHYNVEIFVNPINSGDAQAQTGIIVNDCYNKGSVTRVRPGSSLICALRPSVSLRSDSDGKSANGEYQVE